jgi:hypothetical protein
MNAARPGISLLLAFGAFAAFRASVARADDACTFAPPAPLLQPHAYAGQTQLRAEPNRMQENAQLRAGLHLEIRQGGCVDEVTTDYVFTVAGDGRSQLGDASLIDLARAEIAQLKTRRAPAEQAGLLDFLRRAPGLRLHDGARTLCRDGSVPVTGECAWDSLGGYTVAVKRTGRTTRIVVTESISG